MPFPTSTIRYYVPAGRWTHLISDEVVCGPAWKRETHDFFSLPLLVRPNTILAIGQNQERPDYDFADGVTLRCYELERKSYAEIADESGNTVLMVLTRREEDHISIEVGGKSDTWRVLLVNVTNVTEVEGGSIQAGDEAGTLIVPDSGVRWLVVHLG